MTRVVDDSDLFKIYKMVHSNDFDIDTFLHAKNLTPEEGVRVKLFWKIVKRVENPTYLEKIIESGNIPPIQLTAEETEVLKAGLASFAHFAIESLK